MSPVALRSRWSAAALLIAAGVGALFSVISRRPPERWPVPVNAANAVGDSTCLSCHTEKATFETTAHRLTTRLPSRAAITGNFATGGNVMRTTNPYLHFRMDQDSAGFYQTAVSGKAPDTTSRTERVAYVSGSGRKGQSFLYWKGDHLYQLPVSWWQSLGTWINSPGPAWYNGKDGKANFERAIAPRCFECHATWIDAVPSLTEVNQYNRDGAILGITCERCHASGQEHVAREQSMLRFARRPAIVNPARLDRQQKMDACAQCHGGLGEPKVPSFSYVAGKRLSDYLYLPPLPSNASVDVHGNQVALLERSKCFQASQMTCLTCHDVHSQQRDVAALSGNCLTCHQEQSCGLFPTQGHALKGRCVDCHMPLQKSNLIVSSLEGKEEQALVRNHWIRVYQESVSRLKPLPPVLEQPLSQSPYSPGSGNPLHR